MINNRKLFESRTAFWTLISIICAMIILSMANYYAAADRASSAAGYTGSDDMQQTYEKSPAETGYTYQLIAENGIVNVYSVDPSGGKAFFCETDIPYSLLSETDKKMMKSGITVNSMEELDSILQDFES